jgi:hypothetical protein
LTHLPVEHIHGALVSDTKSVRVCLVGAHTSPTKYLARVGRQYFGPEILGPPLLIIWQESVSAKARHP